MSECNYCGKEHGRRSPYCSKECTDSARKSLTKNDPHGLEPVYRSFVEYFAHTAKGDVKKAMEHAGIPGPPADGYRLLEKQKIKKALAAERELIRKSFFVDEIEVLRGLYKEAQRDGRGTSQTARIQAWKYLGEYLGMFQDKDKDKEKTITYNIINYNDTPSRTEDIQRIKEDTAKNLPLIEEEEEQVIIPGLTIKDYSNE